MYVRKEAVLSSQIEGAQSTLSGLLRFETEAQSGQPIDDIREVSNYVDAMDAWPGAVPLSLRLVREMHARLLQRGRGGTQSPGEFRRSQNWIGGTRPGNALFVPPPITELDASLDAVERFIHEGLRTCSSTCRSGCLNWPMAPPRPRRSRRRSGTCSLSVTARAPVVLHRTPACEPTFWLHSSPLFRIIRKAREGLLLAAIDLRASLQTITETITPLFQGAEACRPRGPQCR